MLASSRASTELRVPSSQAGQEGFKGGNLDMILLAGNCLSHISQRATYPGVSSGLEVSEE